MKYGLAIAVALVFSIAIFVVGARAARQLACTKAQAAYLTGEGAEIVKRSWVEIQSGGFPAREDMIRLEELQAEYEKACGK